LGFPFWLPLHQGHTLFNPVEFQLVVGLTSALQQAHKFVPPSSDATFHQYCCFVESQTFNFGIRVKVEMPFQQKQLAPHQNWSNN
jgi:hypothetical protein